MELIKITTAGSVDDGKSTLIGRLLYDCGCLHEDQLESVSKISQQKGFEGIDYSLFTDGLSAEREQGITIDVAYRYFSTKKRRFILADVPGHEQYTKNMVTGASKSDIAVVLLDARKGMLTQSRRHLFVTSMLEIPHILVIVNKMDEMGYREDVFENIKNDFQEFTTRLHIRDIQYIPVSALKGDMVVNRGNHMNWYGGRTVLDYLENIQIASDKNLIDFRLPIQLVSRPHSNFRGYMGRIEGGTIRKGEKISILPSMVKNKVKEIYIGDMQVEQAMNGQSVLVTLENESDISRGDMLVREKNLPEIADEFEAVISWMDQVPLKANDSYFIKHTTKLTRSYIQNIHHAFNIETLHRETAQQLQCNEIAKVTIKTNDPLIFDVYTKSHSMGSFILIDEHTNNTVGAGVILKKSRKTEFLGYQKNLTVQNGAVLWFTGLSGAGKTTIADKLFSILRSSNVACERLDGDVMREVLSQDLGFSRADRDTNIERAGFVAGLLSKHHVIVLASFISPYRQQRDKLRNTIGNFIEIFVNTPLEICERRDIKGLYQKARTGEISNFTGVSDAYEVPLQPELEINTVELSEEEAVEKIVQYLIANNFLSDKH